MSKNQISSPELILTLLASEVGISDAITGYNQMGYAGIIWYLLAAIFYLFPMVMIFSEYAGSLHSDHGGFYSWLANSIGEKWAFIGTFCWIGTIMIDVLQSVAGLGIHLSGFLQGKDTSNNWHWGIINSEMVEALLGITVTILAVLIATRGIHKITVVSVAGGYFVLAVFIIFIVISLIIFFAHGMHFAQPIHGISSWFRSPNPRFQSPVAVLSFIVYATYAYGGIESSSGLIDKMRHPRKEYPKAILITAALMAVLDMLGILVCGMTANWRQVMNAKGINLYNNSFYLMRNLGIQLSKTLGESTATGSNLGGWLIRFLSLGALIPIMGLVVVLMYSPVKGLIAGSPKDLWPKKIAQFNRHDTPAEAMWIECAIIVVALFFISLTGKDGQQFYQIIVDMGNISMLLPYFFIVIAFVAFKEKSGFTQPTIFFHRITTTYGVAILLLLVMTFGIVMNFLNPILQHQYNVAFWTFVGPVFFLTSAYAMYIFRTRHHNLKIHLTK